MDADSPSTQPAVEPGEAASVSLPHRGRPSSRTESSDAPPKAWQCGWVFVGTTRPNCSKSFGRKSDLQRHHHTHTGTRNHRCPYRPCGKTFIQTSALTVHVRTHTGEKPHVCAVCDKRFSDSSSLARHRKIHSNERPHPCRVAKCNKSFCRKSTLIKHEERDHPELKLRPSKDESQDVGSPIEEDGDNDSSEPLRLDTDKTISPSTIETTQSFGNVTRQDSLAHRGGLVATPASGESDAGYGSFIHDSAYNITHNLTSPYPQDLSMAQSNALMSHSNPSSDSHTSPGGVSNGSTAQETFDSQDYDGRTHGGLDQYPQVQPYANAQQPMMYPTGIQHRQSYPAPTYGMAPLPCGQRRGSEQIEYQQDASMATPMPYDRPQPPINDPVAIASPSIEDMQHVHAQTQDFEGYPLSPAWGDRYFQSPISINPQTPSFNPFSIMEIGGMNLMGYGDKYPETFGQPLPSDLYPEVGN